MNTTAGNTAMHCAHCGRPCAAAIWIGTLPYHEECTHGPSWQQQQYLHPTFYPPSRNFTVPHVPLQEEDVRRIVREELAARDKTQNEELSRRPPAGGRLE